MNVASAPFRSVQDQRSGVRGRMRSIRRSCALGRGAFALERRHAARARSCSVRSTFTWSALAVFLALVLRHALLRPLGRLPSPPDPRSFEVPEMARAHPDLSWHRGRHGRPALDHPHPRHARLGATQPDCHPVLRAQERDLAGRLLVSALPARARPAAAASIPVREFRDDPVLQIPQRERDAAAAADRAGAVLRSAALPWLVWGVWVRVAACTTMHWYISRLAHTRGPQSWMVDGVGTMGHDVPLFAIPTMGESWHNNHHAFPASARHGLFPGQFDPGFQFIRMLETAWPRLGYPDAGDLAAAQGRALADRGARRTNPRRAPFRGLVKSPRAAAGSRGAAMPRCSNR